MSDLLALADEADLYAMHAAKYAIDPPSGYEATAARKRTEAAEWFTIAAALRAKARAGSGVEG